MYRINLERFAYLDGGTFGKLCIQDAIYYTVEAPWRGNEPFVSCLPEAQYSLAATASNKHGLTYVLINEDINVTEFKEQRSSRYACLLHLGNWPSDVKGCISPGLSLEANHEEYKTPGPLMVTDSRIALTQVLDYIDKLGITHIQITHKEATVW